MFFTMLRNIGIIFLLLPFTMLRIKALVVVYNVDDYRNTFSLVYDVENYMNNISLVAVYNVEV